MTDGTEGPDRLRRRDRRRRRDDLAERRALLAIVAVFLGFGGLGFLALNYSGDLGGGRDTSASTGAQRIRSPWGSTEGLGTAEKAKPQRSDRPSTGRRNTSRAGLQEPAAPQPGGRVSSSLDETPDLPALDHLRQTGLTVGAEGIPRVETSFDDQARRAGIETCRFAYGVWEFSPNQTFRFLTTCRGLGRLELVGAYEMRGAEVHLSSLEAGEVRWTSVLRIERPSTMRSRVQAGEVALTVTQRATVVREGLHGEAFRDAFRRRNQLIVPDSASDASRPSSSSPSKSKLEELLGG